MLLGAGSCLALAGCYAQTDQPTQVTSTSAQLNAVGRTDSSPAHYYFQYSTSASALGTGFGLQTPTRTAPANVPGHGSNVSFGETVGSLSPGTVYYDRVCGGDQQVAPDACAGTGMFFTVPSAAQTYVTGTYIYNRTGGSVHAASGPNGRAVEGYVNSSDATTNFNFSGNVTCLLVNGNQAAVGAVGTATSYANPGFYDQPYTELRTFVRDPSTGTITVGPEQNVPGSTPPDCSSASYAVQYAYSNNLVLHQAP